MGLVSGWVFLEKQLFRRLILFEQNRFRRNESRYKSLLEILRGRGRNRVPHYSSHKVSLLGV